jgi:hypothetical protein
MWVPVKEWLIRLADESILERRKVSTIGYIWRKPSSKCFRLMDLPSEPRLMIFEYVVAPEGEVYPVNSVQVSKYFPNTTVAEREQCHVILGIGYKPMEDIRDGRFGRMVYGSENYPYEARKPVATPNLDLLYVSKKVKDEALRIGWEDPLRCFIDHQIFIAVADSKVGVVTRFECPWSYQAQLHGQVLVQVPRHQC